MNPELVPASVSVIIPVVNDDDVLVTLLADLCHQVPGEVIVVDGSDSSATRAVCRPYRYFHVPGGRGNQLACGAEQAGGEILWFLHADSVIEPEALATILQAVANGALGGCFRFRFTGERRWYKTLLEWMINARTAIGVAYGDQGLFFTRAAYEAAHGFSDFPLFEEVNLVKAVKRMGGFMRLTQPIGISCRRWERDGWIRRTLINRLLACGFALGLSPNYLSRLYQR